MSKEHNDLSKAPTSSKNRCIPDVDGNYNNKEPDAPNSPEPDTFNGTGSAEQKQKELNYFKALRTQPWKREDIDFLLKVVGVLVAVMLFWHKEHRNRQKLEAEKVLKHNEAFYNFLSDYKAIDTALYRTTCPSCFSDPEKYVLNPNARFSKISEDYYDALLLYQFKSPALDSAHKEHLQMMDRFHVFSNTLDFAQKCYEDNVANYTPDQLYKILADSSDWLFMRSGLKSTVAPQMQQRYLSRVKKGSKFTYASFFEDYNALYVRQIENLKFTRSQFLPVAKLNLEVQRVEVAGIDNKSFLPTIPSFFNF